jgi:hypothetical protein
VGRETDSERRRERKKGIEADSQAGRNMESGRGELSEGGRACAERWRRESCGKNRNRSRRVREDKKMRREERRKIWQK